MSSPACVIAPIPPLTPPTVFNGSPIPIDMSCGLDQPERTPSTETDIAFQMLTIRMLMSGKEVGSIIGKKGDNVKKYRLESGARINISDGSCPERIVTVTGTVDQIFIAFGMMCQKFEDDFTQSLGNGGANGDDVSCPPVTLRLLVPATQCGSIIGKGGCKIKDIRELTGASIQVASEVLPNSSERTVTISGTARAIAKCIRQLCQILLESPPKGATIPYRPKPALPPGVVLSPSGQILPGSLPPESSLPPGVPLLSVHSSHNPGHPPPVSATMFSDPVRDLDPFNICCPGDTLIGGGHLPGLTLAGLPPMRNHQGGPAPPAQTQMHEILIPNDLIGCIIGRGGNKINEIRTTSGAQIKISNCEDGARERKITIIGTPETIHAAQYLINTSIDLHKRLMAETNAIITGPLFTAAAGMPPHLQPPGSAFNQLAAAAAAAAGSGHQPPPHGGPRMLSPAFMNPYSQLDPFFLAALSAPGGPMTCSPLPPMSMASATQAQGGELPTGHAAIMSQHQAPLTTKLKPTHATVNGTKRSPPNKFSPY